VEVERAKLTAGLSALESVIPLYESALPSSWATILLMHSVAAMAVVLSEADSPRSSRLHLKSVALILEQAGSVEVVYLAVAALVAVVVAGLVRVDSVVTDRSWIA
jgi:hypothetical protein